MKEKKQKNKNLRTPLGKIIIRALIIAILAIVALILAVYFIFQYRPTESSFNNKYPDSYWDKEVLEGFTYGKDLSKTINKYNLSSLDYEYPWEADKVNKNTLTDLQIVDYARYQEELARIVTNEKYKTDYEASVKEVDKYSTGQWDSSKTVQEWIKERLGDDEASYSSVDTTFTKLYDFAVENGYSDAEDDFKEAVKYSENVFLSLENRGFYGEYDEFEKVLTLDTDFYNYLCEFDTDAYNAAVSKRDTLKVIVDEITVQEANLPDWKTYRANNLLGYGGIATDYPNKPVLTHVNPNNNHRYELWFNYYLTTFKMVEYDEANNFIQEWHSNVQEEDPRAQSDTVTRENTILTVSYSVLKGQTGTYSSYEYSVSDHNLITNEDLTPDYAFNIDVENDRLIVWYKIERRGIDYTYFPKYINATRMDEYFQRSAERKEAGVTVATGNTKGQVVKYIRDDSAALARMTQGYYKKINANDSINEFGYDYYEYDGTIANMSVTVKNYLYLYLYEWCGYTEEDLIMDNEEFDQSVDISKPSFSLAIEYKLTDTGLEATIPGNSIKDDPNYPLTYIEILPYFGSTKAGIGGYTIIPDGSGAILEHDNGNTNYSKYQKRVYTTDLTAVEDVNPGSFEDLLFPMYGVVNTGNNSGLLVYAKEAGAQMMLTCDVSGRVDSYNTNYFTAYLRESKEITVGTASYERKTLTKWTNKMMSNDIVLAYDFVETDKMSYAGVAEMYRNVLKNLYKFEEHDTTTSPVLNLEVIGSYAYKTNFIGIPYNAKDSLTTIDQFNQMIEAINKLGIKNINANYLGWRKQNLVNTSFSSMSISSLIGSKAKFQALLAKNNSDVKVYPYVNFTEYEDFTESFGRSHYTSHSVDGKRASFRPYDINSNIQDKTKKLISALSPRYYLPFADKLVKNYNRVSSSSAYLAIAGLGSQVTGDYKKGIETFKVNGVAEQLKVFDKLTKGGITQLSLYTPYDYAFKYTDVAFNVPYQDTAYEILDYSIPFYQLVVNGIFDYSGLSLNAYSEKGVTEHLMRMIETGSNMSFTFTGDSSEKLLQTEYNNYYYTLYTYWLDDVKQAYNALDSLGIYAMRFVNHERVSNNVYRVTYSDGVNSKTIYLNYTRNPYTASDGTVVDAKNYAVGL